MDAKRMMCFLCNRDGRPYPTGDLVQAGETHGPQDNVICLWRCRQVAECRARANARAGGREPIPVPLPSPTRPQDLTGPDADLPERLLDHLQRHCRGEANAIVAKTLARSLGTDERKVRAAASLLREAGELVGTSVAGVHGGFYVIETWNELAANLAVLNSRAASILRVYRALRLAGQRHFSQAIQPLLLEA